MPTASESTRSTSWLKITRPGVVTIDSPLSNRNSIGCWIPTCSASSASSISSSDWKRFGRGLSFAASSFVRSLSEYVR